MQVEQFWAGIVLEEQREEPFLQNLREITNRVIIGGKIYSLQ